MKGVSAWTASLRAARRSWTWSSARWRSADMEPGHSGSRGRGRRRAGGREIGNGKETEFWRRGEKKGEPGLGRVRWPQTWRGREKRGRTTTTKPNVREIYNQSKERRWKVREGRQEEEEERAGENEWDKNNNGKMQERFPRPPPLPPPPSGGDGAEWAADPGPPDATGAAGLPAVSLISGLISAAVHTLSQRSY